MRWGICQRKRLLLTAATGQYEAVLSCSLVGLEACLVALAKLTQAP